MTKSIFLVVPLMAAMGCSTSRMALRPQEPVDRWALNVSPKIKAPLEKPMSELPPLTLSIWALSSAPVVFVANAAPLDLRSWFLMAEPFSSERLFTIRPFDLIYPAPSAIPLPQEDNAGAKPSTRLITAEARIFPSPNN